MKNLGVSVTDMKPSEFVAPDPAAAPFVTPGPLDEKVEAWFAKHFHNNGALMTERVYNLIYAAKEDLKAELRST